MLRITLGAVRSVRPPRGGLKSHPVPHGTVQLFGTMPLGTSPSMKPSEMVTSGSRLAGDTHLHLPNYLPC